MSVDSSDSSDLESPRRSARRMDAEEALALHRSTSSSLSSLLASGATMTKRHNAWLHMSRLEQRMAGLDVDLAHLGREQRHEDYRAKLAAEGRIKGVEDQAAHAVRLAEEQAARDVRSAEARCAAGIKSAEERMAAQQQAYAAKLAEMQRQSSAALTGAEADRIAELAMADAAALVSEKLQREAHERSCQVHDATVATLREECASSIAALRAEHDATVASLREEHSSAVAALEEEHRRCASNLEDQHNEEIETLHHRMSAQEAAFQDEMQAKDESFRAHIARSAASSMVHAAITEEQAWIDSEQAGIALANKTREWEVKCAEAARLTDELAASMAARAALVKEGHVLREKARSAEITLEQEVVRLQALLADEQAKRLADVRRMEDLLADEQASRRAEGEHWAKKMQGLVSETERSVLVCVEVQKKCDLNRLENGALEAALEARAREGTGLSDDLAALWADLAIVTGERDFVRHSYDAKLLENTALEITLSAKEQEVARLTDELSIERAERTNVEKSVAQLQESLLQERKQGDVLRSEMIDLQQAVDADQAFMASACAAATTLNENLLTSRRIADKHGVILHRLATVLGSPRDALVKRAMQEWRRVLSMRRRARDAVRRWHSGLIGMVWRAWHREGIDAKSERMRQQFSEAETIVREEFSQREHEVYEGAQSLVAATQAHYESEMALLQKKLRIATLSPSSPGARQVAEPVAVGPSATVREFRGGPPATRSPPAVEMSADATSDSDSDGDEFHDATPITRELDDMLSFASGHSASPEASVDEFERLRRLLARRSGEIAQLVKELDGAKQAQKDGSVWAEELQAEVEARMAADARLETEIGVVAAARQESADAVAQVKAMQDENAKLKRAEAVAFSELLQLQAKYEDADEAKRSAEAALAERRSDEMNALAQIMELQAKYEQAEEVKNQLEDQLAEQDERSQERGQKEAELAGMGHGRTKAAVAAMNHAFEITEFYEAEVASLRKSLEREILLRNEQKQELEREVVLRSATEAELGRIERTWTGEGTVAALAADSCYGHVAEDAIPAQLHLDLTPRGTRADT